MSHRERDPTVEIEKEIYEKLKDMSFGNRRKLKPFINDLLLEFINKGEISDSQGKNNKISELEDEIEDMKKQNDDSQRMIAKVAHDVYKNRKLILQDVLKDVSVSQKFKKKGNLVGKSATDDKMIIYDELLKKEIIVEVKNNALTCSQHKSDYCEHIHYATMHISFNMKLAQKGVEIPGDDVVMEMLKMVSNTKDDD